MGRLTSFVEKAFPEQLDTAPLGESGFSISVATIMAWASQLAYEAGDPEYLREINKLFGWDIAIIELPSIQGDDDPRRARGIVARTGDACIVAFCGTEPNQVEDWLIDLDAFSKLEGASRGTQAAYDKVADNVRKAVDGTTGPVFITGHSLGGAYAVLCARDLVGKASNIGERLRGVYTFGMPRIGNEAFAREYNGLLGGRLGELTYRLIHGDDCVSQVPPAGTRAFDHRHVGRRLACARDGRFSGVPEPVVAEVGAGDGTAALNMLRGKFADWAERLVELNAAFVRRQLNRILPIFPGDARRVISVYPARSDIARFGADFLPPCFRDHVLDSYLRALGHPFSRD